MDDQPNATRRTLLQTAGVVAGTAALGSGVYAATSTSSTNQSNASQAWYDVYEGDSIPRLVSLYTVEEGYVAISSTETITELDHAGEVVQSNSFESEKSTAATAQTEDGGYLVSGFGYPEDSDPPRKLRGYAFETDIQGNTLWSWEDTPEEGIETYLEAAVGGERGGRYAFGYYGDDDGKTPLGVRFDETGTVVWQETWELPDAGFEYEIGSAIAATDGGALAYEFKSLASIEPDGSVKWTRTYSDIIFEDIIRNPDGGYIAVANSGPRLIFIDETGTITERVPLSFPNGGGTDQVVLTDRGLVVGGTRAETKTDESTGEEYTVVHALVQGVTESGEQRWYLEPGDDSNQDRPEALTGDSESVVMGGGWAEGQEKDSELNAAFLTRVIKRAESDSTATETATARETDPPTDTATETETTTNTATETDTPTETNTSTDTATETPTDTETSRQQPTETETSTETASDDSTIDEDDCRI